jgi:predicted nuclease of predicted toxin-antitoxin system
MGVDLRVVERLRTLGHEVVHLREEGLHRMPDTVVFAKAIAESRAILAFDLDFGEIAAHSGGKRTSVVVFRIRDTRTSNVLERLEAVLARSGDALERGAIVVVEESRHRIRYLPIGDRGAPC